MKYNIPVVDVLFEEIKKANQKQNNLLKDKCNLNENFQVLLISVKLTLKVVYLIPF